MCNVCVFFYSLYVKACVFVFVLRLLFMVFFSIFSALFSILQYFCSVYSVFSVVFSIYNMMRMRARSVGLAPADNRGVMAAVLRQAIISISALFKNVVA